MDSPDNKKIISLRCPGNRPHGKYDLCGHILLAYDDEDNFYVYCSDCKQYYKVEIQPNLNAKMKALSKNQRLDFENNLRVLE